MRSWRWSVLLAGLLCGCAVGPGYYWQAARGQMQIWERAQPIEAVEAAPDTPAKLKERLKLVGDMRAFAIRELGLPDNDSYRRYADLERPYVVWNVFASPALSMQAKTWCMPVVGCVGYLGFFSESAAREQARELQAQGMDVYVGSVPAYSTLGWFDDPVLNTFVNWSEPELARLIFHELSHQLLYVKGDTEFNESFAVTVEEVGARRWLTQSGKQALLPQMERAQMMRSDFAKLTLQYRDALMTLYQSTLSDAEKLTRKQATIAAMRDAYQRMKHERWNDYAGYDAWFAQDINNALLGSVGFYQGLVPQFSAMLAEEHGDLNRFYARVRKLTALPPGERRIALGPAAP